MRGRYLAVRKAKRAGWPDDAPPDPKQVSFTLSGARAAGPGPGLRRPGSAGLNSGAGSDRGRPALFPAQRRLLAARCLRGSVPLSE